MRYFLCLLLALSTSAYTVDRGDRLDHALDTGQAELRVLYVVSPGWAERDDEGCLTGVTVEIMRWFADYLDHAHGLEVSLDFVEETDWTRFYGRVRDSAGGVFGLGNVTITESRREELAFSPPYVNNVAVLITNEDVAEVKEPAAARAGFDGLRALAFEGTLHEKRLEDLRDKHWPELILDRAGSNEEIIDQTAAGTHFGYIDAYNYYRARERGAPLKRHPAFDDPGESFGIIMPLGNDWQSLLIEFFQHDGGLTRKQDYYDLLAKHLGETVADVLTEH